MGRQTTKFLPAAGTRQGPAPLPAAIHLPNRVSLGFDELHALMHMLREPLAAHTYMLLRVQADFASGHVLTTYARLMELMTPPQPERGARRPSPTYEQLRRVLRDLEALGMLRRDASQNAAHGQLRVWLPHVEALSADWEKTRAQRNRTQGSAQGATAAQPA